MSAAVRLRNMADALEADARERASHLRAEADALERGNDDALLDMIEVGKRVSKTPRAARRWLIQAGVHLPARNARVLRTVLERLLAEYTQPTADAPKSATKLKADDRAAAAADAARDAEKILRRAGGRR